MRGRSNTGSMIASSSLLMLAALLASPAAAMQGDGQPDAAAARDSVSEPNAVVDIVVTARKREESIQQIPVAVTSVGGAQLDQ